MIPEALAAIRDLDALPEARRHFLCVLAADALTDADRALIVMKAGDEERRVRRNLEAAATLWLQNGVDLKTVQAWLGHSTAKLTADTYAHYMGSDADTAAVARMNAVLAKPGDAGGTLENLSTGAER